MMKELGKKCPFSKVSERYFDNPVALSEVAVSRTGVVETDRRGTYLQFRNGVLTLMGLIALVSLPFLGGYQETGRDGRCRGKSILETPAAGDYLTNSKTSVLYLPTQSLPAAMAWAAQ
jgi:hypothetical protein